MGSAEAESWRRCRSSRVVEMTEAVPGMVRAGRPRSRVAITPGDNVPYSRPVITVTLPAVRPAPTGHSTLLNLFVLWKKPGNRFERFPGRR